MTNGRFLALGLAAVAAMTFAGAPANADGATVFKKCMACHTLDGKVRQGPSLKGLFGRTAGTDAGFAGKYSKDMVEAGAKGLVWSEEVFAKYIKPEAEGGLKVFIGSMAGKPKAETKMVFPGLKDETEIKELTAYIKDAK